MGRNAPFWGKAAAKKLIDLGMTKKELAKELGVNYTQLCNVMSGYLVCEKIANMICTYLKV